MASLNLTRTRVDGRLLDRGFWLYVVDIRVRGSRARYLYVGRTGDSSSRYAASPFTRLARHLDLRRKAKANALVRRLGDVGLDPRSCRLDMIAVGPIFAERRTLTAHRSVRDKIAALERDIAAALGERGYRILGKHGSNAPRRPGLLRKVLALLEKELPAPSPARATKRRTRS